MKLQSGEKQDHPWLVYTGYMHVFALSGVHSVFRWLFRPNVRLSFNFTTHVMSADFINLYRLKNYFFNSNRGWKSGRHTEAFMKWKWHSGLVGQYNSNSSFVCQCCVFSLINKDIHLKTCRKQMHFVNFRDTYKNIKFNYICRLLMEYNSMVWYVQFKETPLN